MAPFPSVLSDQQQEVQRVAEHTQAVLSELQAAQEAAISQLQTYYNAWDEQGWQRISTSTHTDDLDRDELEKLIKATKTMYLLNPLISRAVKVQQLYVWALGYTLSSSNPVIQQFVDNFLSLRKNKDEFSYEGFKQKEATLQYAGNIFLCFFPNQITGEVRIRTINVVDIKAIYTNPQDKNERWFYKRVIRSETIGGKDKYVWHPDWDYTPLKRVPPPKDIHETENTTVDWEHPIFHIRTGGTDNMRFGFPEIYSAIPWASALRRFYENWSTMMEAYAKVAMQMVRTDKGSLPASRAKVEKAVGTPEKRLIGDTGANTIGQFALHSGGGRLEAVKTAGATTGTEEGRGLAKMVAAGVGLGLNLLGDIDHGNEATANTLDRPTELRMVDRQTQWAEWTVSIIQYAMLWSARAPKGVLKQAGFKITEYQNTVDGVWEYALVPPTDQSADVVMKFPDILERNATERIRALIMGVTAMGKPVTSIIPDRRYVTRRLLEALGENTDMIERLMVEWEKLGVFSDNQNLDDINPEPEPVLGPTGPDVPAV